MKKKWQVIIGLCIAVGLLLFITKKDEVATVDMIVSADLIQDSYYYKYEKKCLAFLKRNYLLTEGGLGRAEESNTVVTNQQLLYMMYLLEKNDQDAFEQNMEYIKTNLITQDGIIGIGRKEELIHKYATYDQMQFFKLVCKAYVKWNDEKYKNMGIVIEKHLYDEYIKTGKLYAYYQKTGNHEIDTYMPLYFLDLSALRLLGEEKKEWLDVYNESKQMIQQSYIGSSFPFYHTEYDWEEMKYNQNHKANMVDTMRIVLNMAQVRQHNPQTIVWLKEKLKKGPIYEEYDKSTGLATESKENVGVYALVAQVGKVIGDIELYTLAIEHMLSLQIKDENSIYEGGFRAYDEAEIDLYENLNALIAF
ncbi:MAG: hypothetical protein ACRDDX_06820 [Cellulosilyticaceae bacterium]